MVKIICRAIDCIFWEDGRCASDKITYDPEEGCLTFELLEDAIDESSWDDDLVDDAENDDGLLDTLDEPLEDLDEAFEDLDDEW